MRNVHSDFIVSLLYEGAGTELEGLQEIETGLHGRPILSLSSSIPAHFAQADYIFADLEPNESALETLRNGNTTSVQALRLLLLN